MGTCPVEENYMKSSLSSSKEKLGKDKTQILPLMGFELLNMNTKAFSQLRAQNLTQKRKPGVPLQEGGRCL